jgi:hypothetical protein
MNIIDNTVVPSRINLRDIPIGTVFSARWEGSVDDYAQASPFLKAYECVISLRDPHKVWGCDPNFCVTDYRVLKVTLSIEP